MRNAACNVCGCTEERACPGGCSWVHPPGSPPLCSRCQELGLKRYGAAVMFEFVAADQDEADALAEIVLDAAHLAARGAFNDVVAPGLPLTRPPALLKWDARGPMRHA